MIAFATAPTEHTGSYVGLRPHASGEKYILVVQDVFSRFIWTEATVDKRPPTVANAFEKYWKGQAMFALP